MGNSLCGCDRKSASAIQIATSGSLIATQNCSQKPSGLFLQPDRKECIHIIMPLRNGAQKALPIE